MYFEKTQNNPQKFAMQDISREEAEMLVQAIIALKEAKYMDHEEFSEERKKLQHIYKEMNSELVKTNYDQQLLKGTRLEAAATLLRKHKPSGIKHSIGLRHGKAR